jgi:hypothetical protein
MLAYAPQTMWKVSSSLSLRRALQKTAPVAVERMTCRRRRIQAAETPAPPNPVEPPSKPAPPPRPETRPPGHGFIPEEPMAPMPSGPRTPDPAPVEPPAWGEDVYTPD